MRFLKYFESEEKYRKVDLQLLFNNFIKYKIKKINKLTVSKFKKIVLEPLFLNKNLSLYYDKTFRKSGKVTEIDYDKDTEKIIIYFWLYYEYNDHQTLKTINISLHDNTPYYLYVFNEETEFEKEVEMLKNSEKYNL